MERFDYILICLYHSIQMEASWDRDAEARESSSAYHPLGHWTEGVTSLSFTQVNAVYIQVTSVYDTEESHQY